MKNVNRPDGEPRSEMATSLIFLVRSLNDDRDGTVRGAAARGRK